MITDQIAEEQRLPARSQQPRRDFAEVYSRVMDLEQQARTLIRQRPVVAVLTAASVGYLTARLVSRAMR